NVEILHHDIRAENILITIDETAKLANCSLNAVTLKQDQNLERARYCAPELLKNSNAKYNNKCEVYSFGILLWEIVEEKAPYEDYKDIIEIVNLENNQMPEKFKNLVINAVNHDPEFRPNIIEMLKVLKNCLEDSKSKAFHTSNVLQNQRPSEPTPTIPKSIDHSGMTGATAEIALVIVPFTKFVPLIKEIGAIFDEIIDVEEAAEHNKRTCKLLKDQVQIAELVVRELREKKYEKEDFFNNRNYSSVQELA
ncbi:kinase-like protein, partial [Rhizophagus irregularis]